VPIRAAVIAIALAGCAAGHGAGAPRTLRAGDVVPDVQAKNQDGALVRLSQYRGHPLVVYFYPKDRTPG
jgi:peroxiredoxin Q/BCP